MYGEADTPSTYTLMTHFFGAKVIAKKCGVQEFYQWNRYKQLYEGPAIWINAGPMVEEGQDSCALSATFAHGTVFMHPELAFRGSNNAVVAWKSPVTAMVTLSGSVQAVDSHVSGISWEVDQGLAILAGPTEMTNDNLASFGPTTIPIAAGESLYLEIGRGAARGENDSTAVTLNITSP